MKEYNQRLEVEFKELDSQKLVEFTYFNRTNRPTLVNLNPDIVIVKDDGEMIPISVGEGYVKVKKDNVVKDIKIIVKEEAKAAIMNVEKKEISIGIGSNSSINEETIEITFKDQYERDFEPKKSYLKISPEKSDVVSVKTNLDKKIIKVTIKAKKEGEASIKLSYQGTKLKETIKVNITKAEKEISGYVVDVDTTALNLEADNPDTTEKETRNIATVAVFAIDKNGNKIKEIILSDAKNAKNKIVTVDRIGKASTSIVEVMNKNQIKAKKEGKGYVQVFVDSKKVETLNFNVINTKSIAKTAEFDSDRIVVNEEDWLMDTVTTADEKSDDYLYNRFKWSIYDDSYNEAGELLEEIVTIKDQFDKEIDVDSTGRIYFDYEITNIRFEDMDIDKSIYKLSEFSGFRYEISAKRAAVDIVVKEVAFKPYGESKTENLLESPQIITLFIGK